MKLIGMWRKVRIRMLLFKIRFEPLKEYKFSRKLIASSENIYIYMISIHVIKFVLAEKQHISCIQF